MTEGAAHWLPAQHHAGENIGDTPTHAVFVEPKGAPDADTRTLGAAIVAGAPLSRESGAGRLSTSIEAVPFRSSVIDGP